MADLVWGARAIKILYLHPSYACGATRLRNGKVDRTLAGIIGTNESHASTYVLVPPLFWGLQCSYSTYPTNLLAKSDGLETQLINGDDSAEPPTPHPIHDWQELYQVQHTAKVYKQS